jgi:hypothetical protein
MSRALVFSPLATATGDNVDALSIVWSPSPGVFGPASGA